MLYPDASRRRLSKAEREARRALDRNFVRSLREARQCAREWVAQHERFPAD
jgi:hypothetical protein